MKKIILMVTGLVLALSSCSNYLDINYDPASPSEENLTSDMIFPGTEMALACQYGARLRIIGGYLSEQFAQDFATTSYLESFSRFHVTAELTSQVYTYLMTTTLSNLQTVIEKANAEDEPGTVLAATCIRAFAYQALVDCYENVPFTEAFTDTTAPKYDDGEDIYVWLIEELLDAKAKAIDSDVVCTNFLFPDQTAGVWIQFANSILLKLYMRMGDTEGAASLVQENNFITADVEYADCWDSSSTGCNPYYREEFYPGTYINVILNGALLSTMEKYGDNRLYAFFEPNGNGNYKGGISGLDTSTYSFTDGTSSGADYFCRPVQEYDTPLSLLSLAEVDFFLAEYYAKTGGHTAAKTYYDAAITASFESAGADGADTVIANCPYDSTDYMYCIGIQKYVALSGINNFEAYCELRRIRYPAINTVSGSTFISSDGTDTDFSSFEVGTLYTPILVDSNVGAGRLLERFPYAEASSSRNSNCPAFEGYTTPVFWAE